MKGYYSYTEYLEVSSKIKAGFPFAVPSVDKIGHGYSGGDIYVVEIALPGTLVL